jgi:hypothetical protein
MADSRKGGKAAIFPEKRELFSGVGERFQL